MATLFSTPPLKDSWISRHRLSPLTIRFLCRLSVCTVYSFGLGSVIALYAMPRILRMCSNGDPRGFAAFVMVNLWILNLADMWHYVRFNLLLLWETRGVREPFLVESHEAHREGSAQI
jgi:hypothetical protein